MQQLTIEQAETITLSELIKLIFRRIKEGGSEPYNLIRDFLPGYRHNTSDKRIEEFENKFQEAWATLLRRGLIMQTVRVRDTIGYPVEFRLTSTGQKSDFGDGILILVDDAQQIVNKLKEKIPDLNPVIEQYFLESLRACQEGLYISSVICLGAASERAIHCLKDAVINYDSSRRADIEKQTTISALTRYLSDNINRIFTMADGAFRSTLRDKLEGTARLYRLNRNVAGHPSNIPQDWERIEQENYLNQFRRYITTVFEAIDLLEANSP